ncbi:MAG: hypothetical protein NXI22_21220 [bacterium]|nr:hypothetical protein [bacterium]
MSNRSYFAQDCPTCGRVLHVQVNFLGKKVVCGHCRGDLIATDPANRLDIQPAAGLMSRAKELLDVEDLSPESVS